MDDSWHIASTTRRELLHSVVIELVENAFRDVWIVANYIFYLLGELNNFHFLNFNPLFIYYLPGKDANCLHLQACIYCE